MNRNSSPTAMILAAGRGNRLRPLTDTTPKPLLKAGGKPLIVWQIEALKRAGYANIVINVAWLADKLVNELGDGDAFGVRLHWSIENPALETAGGIAHALPLLGDEPFPVVSGDIWSEFDYASLRARRDAMKRSRTPSAHLVMVPNPSYHPGGDFLCDGQKLYSDDDAPEGAAKLTFGNIALYSPALFAGLDPNLPEPLSPHFREWIRQGAVTAEIFGGDWRNVGTEGELKELRGKLEGVARGATGGIES